MRLSEAQVTVKDRILLHLLDHWGRMHQGVWPQSLTQDGIAASVGISRSHVAVTLPDLIEEGLVESGVERVEGRPRRVKVYGLSYQGGTVAGKRARELLGATVTAVDGTGEWDIPLDGLIQVHKVHMLVAIRLLSEDNRLDLVEAAEFVRPREAAEAEGATEEEGPGEAVEAEAVVEEAVEAEAVVEEAIEAEAVVEEAAEEEVADAEVAGEGLPSRPVEAAPHLAVPAVRRPPTIAQGPGGQPRLVRGLPPGAATSPGAQARPGQPASPWQPMVQQPPPFWSPLRYGTGRRPSVMGVGLELVFGFLMLLGGVVLWGLDPVCIAAGLPLLVIGALVGLWGFRSLWALGDRREAWTAAALSAYAIPPVVMACIAVFGWRVAIDLLWLALAVGVPSLVLVAGTGREVGRRATFALFFGPVLLISALTLAVLDPEGFGETGAMPVLTVSVGAGWGFTGFVTARKREGGRDPLSVVAAGGSAGLAIAAAAGGMDLAAAGDLTLTATLAVVLWVGTAAYVTVVSLLPSLRRLRPGARASYAVLAVSGAAALITAAAIFLADGMHVVGSVEAIMGLAMVVMTAPEMRGIGPSAAALSVLGALLGVSSVLAVSVAL